MSAPNIFSLTSCVVCLFRILEGVFGDEGLDARPGIEPEISANEFKTDFFKKIKNKCQRKCQKLMLEKIKNIEH